MAWLASDLVATVKLRAMLPTSSSAPGTADADVLAHANDELQSFMVPMLLSINEEYFTATTDVPLVAGQDVYRLPDRSAASKLREVWAVGGNILINLPRIEPEALNQWVNNATGVPAAFIMEAGGIRLVPKPSASGYSLRMRYFARPALMTVDTAQYARILTASYLSPSSTTLTLAHSTTAGQGMLTPSLGDGYLYDLIAGRPPFEHLGFQGWCTAVGPNFRFSWPDTISPSLQGATGANGAQIGDFITALDVSPIVQLPQELHSLLAQRVTARILHQLGRFDAASAATTEAERMAKVALNMLTPRVDGAARVVMGLLQSGRRNIFRVGS